MIGDIPIKQSVEAILTEQEVAAIEAECHHYEQRPAAAIEALKIVQNKRQWISDEVLAAIADLLTMSPAELEGVATFYNHIYRQPVGKNVLHLCDSVSCWIRGYEDVQTALENELNIQMGQTTEDNQFTLLANACLGGCDKGPVLMANGEYVENLNPADVPDLINKLRGEI